jgi:hypothetical protein
MEEIKKELVDALKDNGLEVAEDAVLTLFKVMYPFITRFVLATPNKLDDIVVVLLPVLEPIILDYIDKIDGKKDN